MAHATNRALELSRGERRDPDRLGPATMEARIITPTFHLGPLNNLKTWRLSWPRRSEMPGGESYSEVAFIMLNIFHGIHTGALPALSDEEADVSQRLRKHVDMLARVIGDRNVLTHPHNLDLAGSFIERVLADLQLATATQPYTVMDGKPVRNIDAQMDGAGAADEVIVIG